MPKPVAPHFQHKRLGKKDAKPKGADDSALSENLQKIYANSDGTMPDMHTFTRRRRTPLLAAIAFLVLVGGTVFTAYSRGWLTDKTTNTNAAETITFAINGPEQVTVGETVTYKIEYTNNDSSPVTKTQLQVRWPVNFVIEKTEPAVSPNGDWALGALGEGRTQTVIVSGKFWGDVGSEQSVRAFLNYVPANFSSDFQKVATRAVRLQGSPLGVAIAGPASVSPGNPVTYTFTVTPATGTWNNVALSVEPGFDFSKKEATPAADTIEPYRWTLKSVTSTQTVTLTGIYAANPEATNQTLTARLLYSPAKQGEGQPVVLATASTTVPVAEAPLQAQLTVNGSAEKAGTMPGDTIAASVTVKNASQTAMPHVRVRLSFDAPSYQQKSLLNWAKIDDAKDGSIAAEQLNPDRRRGSITWTEKQVAEFASLKPGQSVTLDVRLPVRSGDETSLENYPGQTIDVFADAQHDTATAPVVVRSNGVPVTLNSDTVLDVRTETTTTDSGLEQRKITWLLSNSFHELSNLTAEAELYGDITWAQGEVPIGKVAYDEAKKKLRWTIESLPTNVDSAALTFTVTINKKNPSQSQLVSKVTLTGTDTATKTQIQIIGAPVENN